MQTKSKQHLQYNYGLGSGRDKILGNQKHKNTKFKYLKDLRYYATFKVRKFESLFHKINTCLQKTTTCIGGLQAEQTFSVNI